jgi:hypothetical protein
MFGSVKTDEVALAAGTNHVCQHGDAVTLRPHGYYAEFEEAARIAEYHTLDLLRRLKWWKWLNRSDGTLGNK